MKEISDYDHQMFSQETPLPHGASLSPRTSAAVSALAIVKLCEALGFFLELLIQSAM